MTIYRENKGGGCFKRLVASMKAMLYAGWEVHYVSTHRFPLEHPNLYFHRLPLLFSRRFFFYGMLPILMGYISYLHARNGFDRLFVFHPIYAFACLLTRIVWQTTLVTFLRGDWIREIRFETRKCYVVRLCMAIEKAALRWSDVVCAVTRELKREVESRCRITNIQVLHNNIQVDTYFRHNTRQAVFKELGIENSCFLVGFIGPLLPIKRVDVLINSFVYTPKNLRLVIVGSGRVESQLKALVAQNGLQESVIFAGWRNDVPAIMSALDLMVLPSEYEGCPGVLLEALGCETLSIGSDVAGIREVLQYDELLFAPFRTKKLRLKIEKIARDAEYRIKISQLFLSRRDSFVFDWEYQIIDVIERVGKNSHYGKK